MSDSQRIQRKPSSITTADLKSQKSSGKCKKKLRVKRIKSTELRSGILYANCDCYRRNGLQDYCPRILCGGNLCKTKPWPQCDLGIYFMRKLKRYHDKVDEIPPVTYTGTKQDWLAEVSQRRLKLQQAQALRTTEKYECSKKLN